MHLTVKICIAILALVLSETAVRADIGIISPAEAKKLIEAAERLPIEVKENKGK